jgi:hypothetical protein
MWVGQNLLRIEKYNSNNEQEEKSVWPVLHENSVGGGRYRYANTSPTLIVPLWICALKTFCLRIPNCTRCVCRCETGVAPVGFPCRWKSPAISWSRPVAPLPVAYHILPERKAWARSRPLGEKLLCGSSVSQVQQLNSIMMKYFKPNLKDFGIKFPLSCNVM